jgi:hypothetical protein
LVQIPDQTQQRRTIGTAPSPNESLRQCAYNFVPLFVRATIAISGCCVNVTLSRQT